MTNLTRIRRLDDTSFVPINRLPAIQDAVQHSPTPIPPLNVSSPGILPRPMIPSDRLHPSALCLARLMNRRQRRPGLLMNEDLSNIHTNLTKGEGNDSRCGERSDSDTLLTHLIFVKIGWGKELRVRSPWDRDLPIFLTMRRHL